MKAVSGRGAASPRNPLHAPATAHRKPKPTPHAMWHASFRSNHREEELDHRSERNLSHVDQRNVDEMSVDQTTVHGGGSLETSNSANALQLLCFYNDRTLFLDNWRKKNGLPPQEKGKTKGNLSPIYRKNDNRREPPFAKIRRFISKIG